MNNENAKARSIFASAVEDYAPDQWPRFLDDACHGDGPLRQRVELLLRAHQGEDSFLDRGDEDGAAATAIDRPLGEGPGTVIGPYKLLQQIGEGGFGVVFLAEQERPVRRRVALKIVKSGMDTREVIARFEAERQALAMMDHPNIAKVLDAGATDRGRPYFVMELIQGVPITEYCDQCQLTTRERLELFAAVCQAVQHAHQKGVIHRDIKPSNVLVAIQDGRPEPKIIDFGVAKAINQRLTEHTLMTAFAQMVGTPLYMSPEQAELSPLGVDTRSDIYSLGVLLYELLTSTTPFDRDRLHSVSYDEVRRIIREEEPPRPSARLSTLSAELATTIAERRRTEARRHRQTVRGELDWIVMKCLEKDRNRRYETANGLARDIDRYLQDEPVQACPPSTAYRLQKLARRNKAALIALSTVVSSLVLLVISLAYSNRKIMAERNQKAEALVEAEVERQRAHANFLKVRIAMRDIITQAAMGMNEWRQLPPPLRKRFSEAAVKFYSGLIQDAGPQPSLQYDAAVGYRTIGKLHYMAGELDAAVEPMRKSIEILQRLVTQFPADCRYRGQLAWCQYQLGEMLFARLQLPEAQSAVESAVELYESLLDEKSDEFDFQDQLADCYHKLSEISKQLGDPERATEMLQFEISIHEGRAIEQNRDYSRDYRLAEANLLLGELLAGRGQATEAHRLIRRTIKLYDRLAVESPYDPNTNNATAAEGYMQVATFCAAAPGFAGEFDEAGRGLKAVLPRYLAEFPVANNHYGRLVLVLAATDREQQSVELVRQLAESVKHVTDATVLANALYAIALMRLRLGDVAAYREACQALVDLPIDSLHDAAKARPIWTPCLAPNALDDPTLPVKLGEEFVAANSVSQRQFGFYALGAAHFRAGQYEQAARRLEESIAAFPNDLAPVTDSKNYSRLFLAMTQWKLGQKDEARRLLAETLPDVERELQSPASGWNRRATLEILRSEAELLIAPPEVEESEEEHQPGD